MKRLLSLLFLIPFMLGWYDWGDEYAKVYIAGVNDVDINRAPTSLTASEDGVSVSLPLSVRVNTEEGSYGFPIQQVKLQWRKSTESTWTDITPAYSDTSENFLFGWNEFHFGRRDNPTLDSTDGISSGDIILVRIYVANTTNGYQNADLSVDTTEEGTNGWEDPWVTSYVIQANVRPGGVGR
jgi:hypothetical protein